MTAWESDETGWELEDKAPSDDHTWTNQKGQDTPIADLTTDHLKRIVQGLQAGRDYGGQEHKLPNLMAELDRREK